MFSKAISKAFHILGWHSSWIAVVAVNICAVDVWEINVQQVDVHLVDIRAVNVWAVDVQPVDVRAYDVKAVKFWSKGSVMIPARFEKLFLLSSSARWM